MKRLLVNWSKVVLVGVPLAIIAYSASAFMAERWEGDAERAVRLVGESRSRKENFTVQQYLYATAYHRRDNGEPVTIEGWRAVPSPDGTAAILVEFGFTDERGAHRPQWQVDLARRSVTPKNDEAKDLSWH